MRTVEKNSQSWHPEYDADWEKLPPVLTELVTDRTPFAYLRFGDGEFNSILGKPGGNSDKHHYFPDTLGVALQETLVEIADCYDRNIFVGAWLEKYARRRVTELGIVDKIRWFSTGSFQFGIADLITYDFLQALQQRLSHKVFVGPAYTKPFADGIVADFIEIPEINCWLQYDATYYKCRNAMRSGSIFVYCCGMMAPVLGWRLSRGNGLPGLTTTHVDFGHVAGAICGVDVNRFYLNPAHSPEKDAIRDHYQPLLGIK